MITFMSATQQYTILEEVEIRLYKDDILSILKKLSLPSSSIAVCFKEILQKTEVYGGVSIGQGRFY